MRYSIFTLYVWVYADPALITVEFTIISLIISAFNLQVGGHRDPFPNLKLKRPCLPAVYGTVSSSVTKAAPSSNNGCFGLQVNAAVLLTKHVRITVMSAFVNSASHPSSHGWDVTCHMSHVTGTI